MSPLFVATQWLELGQGPPMGSWPPAPLWDLSAASPLFSFWSLSAEDKP